MISAERLAAQFAHLATITAPGKGINRLAFTESDRAAHAYIKKLMTDAGLKVREDAFGNIIGHLDGSDEALPAIMCGSHVDSVPEGGNYDGVVGILTAIEIARSMKEDAFIPLQALEIVLFQCEESSRFGAATLGSKAMRGHLTAADLERLHDKQGQTLQATLDECGYEPSKLAECVYDKPLSAFFEVHIEQGKVLEERQLSLGIVTGIAAPTRLLVQIDGKADHSGATPMDMRQDALCAAAELILYVEQVATKATQTGLPVVGTVGVVNNIPNVMNVIPGSVQLGIDVRSISATAKAEVIAQIQQRLAAICNERQLSYTVEEVSNDTPVAMADEIISRLAAACEARDTDYCQMPSGAGHDAMHWADYCPTGMLFIPCRDGISHNPAEYAEQADIVRAAQILENVIRNFQ